MAAQGGTGGPGQESVGKPESTDWAKLYEECHDQVSAYISRRVRCPHDSDDLVHDVFVSIIARGGYLEHAEFYLLAAARNRLCRYWHKRDKDVISGQAFELRDEDRAASDSALCDYESDPVTQATRRETRQVVLSMMGELSPLLMQVLTLYFLEELTTQEAAEHAGCSHETMKKRLTRARGALLELSRKRDSAVDLDTYIMNGTTRSW